MYLSFFPSLSLSVSLSLSIYICTSKTERERQQAVAQLRFRLSSSRCSPVAAPRESQACLPFQRAPGIVFSRDYMMAVSMTWGSLLFGVPIMRALVFGVCIRANNQGPFVWTQVLGSLTDGDRNRTPEFAETRSGSKSV